MEGKYFNIINAQVYREAIDVFSSASRGAKRKLQFNANALNFRLREFVWVCGKKNPLINQTEPTNTTNTKDSID